MFDTITLTKAFGSLCAALLVFMVGKTIADGIFQPGSRHLPPAFVIDTGVDDVDDDAPAVAELSLDEALAVADAAAGERLWGQCRACHVVDDTRNGVGPYLVNVMGREIGAVDGFRYSGALPEGVWTADAMSEFIRSPRNWAPGTSMSYAGMSSVTDRANLIAYIASFSPDWEWEGGVDEAAVEPEAPVEEPVEEAAVEPEAPAEDEAPAEEAVEEAAVEPEAPVEEAVEEAAVEPEEAADEAVEEAAVEAEAPAEEAVEEAAVEPEAPAEEAVEEAAVQSEAPAEEAVEEAAVEPEAPAEEAVEEAAVEAEAPAEELSPIAAAFANGDAAAGARIWRQCAACHAVDQQRNLAGPYLTGVIGREIGSVEGFRYSGNLPEGVWTLEELDAFLENPRAYAPRTTMSFNGLRSLEDRANVLAFIDSHD